MVSQSGLVQFTIMWKTAGLTVTIIDNPHKEGEPQKVIVIEIGCFQSAVSKHIYRKLSGREKCGKKKGAKAAGVTAAWIVRKSPFKSVWELHKEWTEVGYTASRATTHRRIQEMGFKCSIPLVRPILYSKQCQKRLTLAEGKK